MSFRFPYWRIVDRIVSNYLIRFLHRIIADPATQRSVGGGQGYSAFTTAMNTSLTLNTADVLTSETDVDGDHDAELGATISGVSSPIRVACH